MIGYGKLLLRDYGEKPESAVLRTEMESGAKQAQVRSLQLVARPAVIDYSSIEYGQFKTWYRDTLARGSAWFFLIDPRDGISKLTRIVRGEYDSKSYIKSQGDELRWEVSLVLEIWE